MQIDDMANRETIDLDRFLLLASDWTLHRDVTNWQAAAVATAAQSNLRSSPGL